MIALMTTKKTDIHDAKRRTSVEPHDGESRSSRSSDLARETWAMRHGAAFLASGFVLVPELSSQGGTSTENYKESREKAVRKISYVREVDHPELDLMAQKAIYKARRVLSTHTARFVPGNYFVGIDEFEAIDKMLEDARHAAVICNKFARQLKSERVTIVEVYPFRLDVEDRRIALRLGASIHKRLQILRSSYDAEDRRDFQTAMAMCINMEKLVDGRQKDAVRIALKASEDQRESMILRYGGRRGGSRLTEEERVRAWKGQFDYGPIDTAIEMFAPAADAVALGK